MARLHSCIPELLSTLQYGPQALALLQDGVRPYGPFDLAITHVSATDLPEFLALRSRIDTLIQAAKES